jgi:hypothetical protein
MLIRYFGPVGIPGGYGRAANETCMAILAAGLDLEIQTYHPSAGPGRTNYLHERYQSLVPHIRDDNTAPRPHPDVVIVHTLPMDCAKVLEVARIREHYPSAYCVAYTTWEGAFPPPQAMVDALDAFDTVWSPSSQLMSEFPALQGLWHKRHKIVPHAYDDQTIPADRFRPPGAFRFYTIGTWTVRKNLQGLIMAYLRAFDRDENTSLLIQSFGADPYALLMLCVASMGKHPRDLPAISLMTEWIDEGGIASLHGNCDCFVTASRGEAWHFPAFDAMLARRHIIAPLDQGSDEYLMDTSAWRYRTTLAPATAEAEVVPGTDFRVRRVGTDLTCRDNWREPDITELSVLMRRARAECVTDLHVAYDPAQRYGRAAVGQLIRRHLEEGCKQ